MKRYSFRGRRPTNINVLLPPFVLAVDREFAMGGSVPAFYSADELPVLLSELGRDLECLGIIRVESSPELHGSEDPSAEQDSFAVVLGFRREKSASEIPVYLGELFWGEMAEAVRDAMSAGRRHVIRELRKRALTAYLIPRKKRPVKPANA